MERISGMSITKRLLELDPTLKINPESDWGGDGMGFEAFNDAGLECEVGEFMYGLLRALKPARVLETGTHVGVGASYMGMALKDNKKGELDTVEFLPDIYSRAVQRIKRMGLEKIVHCHLEDVAKWEVKPDHRYDFILLDTEPQTRFAEFVKFYDYLNEGGFIFIHDLHRHMHQIPNEEHGFAWPFGKIPSFITELVKHRVLRPFYLPTPRGLTGFYKTSPNDYKWEVNISKNEK
jgi:predicted O-methyltransferase YrrM